MAGHPPASEAPLMPLPEMTLKNLRAVMSAIDKLGSQKFTCSRPFNLRNSLKTKKQSN